ncbi:hypothetical protein DB345_12840 [Spartobacteria bacterium LR76]|nr:hypothetical protein DB345_12840 [Spartobacteria bacterium LR76]
MKINICILWIDDNKDFVDASKPKIEQWIADQGFQLNVVHKRNSTGVIDLLKTENIVFLVLDYHLGKKDGDKVIKEIRNAQLYQDIVFYSQGLDRNNFNPEDGVFFVDRGDLENRIKNLLDLKIRSACDFATFRGWFVADSIELEIIMGRILAKCFGDQQETFQSRVLEQDGLFDFYKKHQVLNGIIKDRLGKMSETSPNYHALKSFKKLLDSFPDDIIHPRNGLAHQPDEPHKSGKRIRTRSRVSKEILDTPESLCEFRKKLRVHYENLIALEKIV